ncbi:hypothetical protein Ancab_018099 [Ancistrocladus abbreviatus]
MVNSVKAYTPIMNKLMKLAGVEPRSIDMEPDSTTVNFWVPRKPSTTKPAVVLLHGFAGDGILTWQFQVMGLTKKFSVYVPDLLFFGGSTTKSKDRSAKFQADCIAKGLKKLGVERCVVVGFSYGGIVGLKMAEYHPELVAGVVVNGFVLSLTESMTKKILQRLGLSSWSDLLLPNTAQGVKRLFDIGTFKIPFWVPNFFFKDFLEVIRMNRKEKGELLEALVVSDDAAATHKFHQRIYLLWGKADKIFTVEDASDLKMKLGEKSRLETIKKAGHLAQLERPFVFNKRLKQLLTSLHLQALQQNS